MTPQAKARVLIVDDHIEMAHLLADQLDDLGYATAVAAGGEEAIRAAESCLPDVAIVDLRMEQVDGFDVLEGVHALDATIPVLIMTAFGAIDTAIEAIKRGAFHYITKPFQLDEVLVYVERAVEARRLRDENKHLRRLALDRSSLDAMVGRSPKMQQLFDLIERVAQATAPALIRGESGTGKELVARSLHFAGPRRDGPFVAVNCTALPEALLESELFGHLKGSFTGASEQRRGLFLEANKGTLFLDEIGDMQPDLQAKLLRVLEDGEIRAVGSDITRRVDVRLIAATHQTLEEHVAEGSFRKDLFYRLNVVPLVIPPLRERAEDIPLLIEHFLQRALARNPTAPLKRFSPALIAALTRHPWPGNVRELENVVERLVIVCTNEEAGVEELEQHPLAPPQDTTPLERARAGLLPLRQLREEYISWVLERCDGNKTRAAEILGIDVSTLHRRDRSAGK